MKPLFLTILALALIFGTAAQAYAPTAQTWGNFGFGVWYPLIRVTETEGGTIAEMVSYFREVSG